MKTKVYWLSDTVGYKEAKSEVVKSRKGLEELKRQWIEMGGILDGGA